MTRRLVITDPDPDGAAAHRARERRHRLIVVAVVCVVAALVVGGIVLRARADASARAAAGCSDLDRATFEGQRINRPPVPPVGQDDGACALAFSVPGDAATALGTVDAAMAADGWTPSGSGAGPRLYTRGPELVTAVPGGSGGRTTEVTLSIAPD